MPNGGSDNCSTCWFNRKNKIEAGSIEEHRRDSGEPYCEIRDEPIEDPGYTYCANHPYRRSGRDPIPVGPMLVAEVAGVGTYRRVPLKPSPDTEEIRQHLLNLLNKPDETDAHHVFPVFPNMMDIVVWQLGEFRERRAVEPLRRMEKALDAWRADLVRETLERIVGETGSEE